MRSSAASRVLLFLILPLAVPLAGCVRTASPEGWAAPLPTDDGSLLLSLDKGHISSVELSSPSGPAAVQWTFPNDALESDKDLDPKAIYPAPVSTSSAVFVATFAEGLFALDPATGTQIWHRSDLGENIVSAFARTPDGALAVGTSDGWLHLLEPETGDAAAGWPAHGIRLPDGIWATPVATPDSLIVATMGGEVLALDYAAGQPLWESPFKADGAILDLAPLPDDRLFVPSLDGHVYLLDARTGQRIGAIETDHWVWMQPAVSGGKAFFGDLRGDLYALDITAGTLAWHAPSNPGDNLPSMERLKSRPIVTDGTLIVADSAPAVHFLDADTGRRLNRVPIDAKTVRAPLLELDGAALVLATHGKLFLANPDDLSVIQIPFGAAQ